MGGARSTVEDRRGT